MPCNLNQRELAGRVGDGVAAAGGVALEFNTIAVSDNQSQATPGMRASLISREVIADSIELMVHAHDFDALVCLVGCDKTVPAALMALARVDKPAVVLYSGPMRAGRLHGREVTIQDVWEAVGAEERGLIPRAELDELERFACPGAGNLRGPLHRQHDGRRARLPRHHDAGRRPDPGGRAGSRRVRPPQRAGTLATSLASDRAHVPRPPRAAERDDGHRGDRRLDERHPASARDRARGGRAADARRARRDRSAHAGDREPRAVRPLRGGGPAPRRRDGGGDQRARSRRPVRRRRADGHGRDAGRSDAATRRHRTARSSSRSSSRSRRPARCTRCAATSRPTAASSRPRERCAGSTAARRASSTARRRAPTPSGRASCRQATCSSSATKGRPAGRACARC